MKMKKKPVLITGSTGFLGRHIIETLVSESSNKPLALARSQELWKRYDWTQPLNEVDVIEGSVTDPTIWQNDSRLNGLGGIFHLAAIVRHNREQSEEVYHTNVEGTLNMVRLAARQKCRMIFVSTSGTVGCFKKAEDWADEHSPYCVDTVGTWPYYDSKIQAETKAQELAKELGVQLIIVRPPILLGPGDHRFRATGHILRLLRGKLPFLIKGGIHFVDIRDAAKAMIAAMNLETPKPIYHLNGTACSIDEFFEMIHKVSNVKPPKWHLPSWLAKFLANTTKKLDKLFRKKNSTTLPDPVVIEMATKFWDVRSRYSKDELQFVPREPRLTLMDTVKWLRKNHKDLQDETTSTNISSRLLEENA